MQPHPDDSSVGAVSPAPPRAGKLDWIQALRALAAVSVVLTHARFYFAGTAQWEVVNWLLLPFASGVDLFFVISGFIMALTTGGDSGGPASSARFLWKRIRRIWPPYFVMTLVTAGYYYVTSKPISMDQIASSLAFLPYNHDDFFGNQVVPQGWTLTYEFYFYCALAVTLAFGRYRWLAFGAWIVALLMIVPIQNKVPLLDPGAPFTSYAAHPYLRIATNPIIWEFVLGVLAGVLYRRSWWRLDGALARIGTWCAITFLLVWTALCYNYINLELGIGYAAAIAVLGAATKSYRLPLPGIVIRIGDWSYSLYIEHFLLVSILVSVPREGPFGGAIALGLFVATPVLCVAVALSSGEFLERRLPMLLNRLLPMPSSRAAS